MRQPDPRPLIELVRDAARDAILPNFAAAEREFKGDGSIVTAVDKAMQERLAAGLAARWPEFAMLGEEMSPEQQAALVADPGRGLWIVDPLDGTSNFTAGIPYCSVSVALMVDGRPQLGVVYDPFRDECFHAVRGAGAWLNDHPLQARPVDLALARCIAAIDFKRLPSALAQRFAADPPYASQRSFGSVALDWCWVAAGRFHVYLHGRQKLWDYAAGYLVLAEAGGFACDLHGEPVFASSGAPRSAIASADARLFEEFRRWIAATGGD